MPARTLDIGKRARGGAKHRGRNAVVEHGFVRITDGGGSMAMAI